MPAQCCALTDQMSLFKEIMQLSEQLKCLAMPTACLAARWKSIVIEATQEMKLTYYGGSANVQLITTHVLVKLLVDVLNALNT